MSAQGKRSRPGLRIMNETQAPPGRPYVAHVKGGCIRLGPPRRGFCILFVPVPQGFAPGLT